MASRTFVLATYQSWMTPDKLFDKLIQRYHVPELVLKNEESPEKYVKDIRTRVALVLKAWMTKHKQDFSEHLIDKIREFVENRLVKDGRGDLAKMLRASLTKLVSNIEGLILIIEYSFKYII